MFVGTILYLLLYYLTYQHQFSEALNTMALPQRSSNLMLKFFTIAFLPKIYNFALKLLKNCNLVFEFFKNFNLAPKLFNINNLVPNFEKIALGPQNFLKIFNQVLQHLNRDVSYRFVTPNVCFWPLRARNWWCTFRETTGLLD